MGCWAHALVDPQGSPPGLDSQVHSRYTATTTAQNAWERVVFSYSSSPDTSQSALTVNSLVLYFSLFALNGHR